MTQEETSSSAEETMSREGSDHGREKTARLDIEILDVLEEGCIGMVLEWNSAVGAYVPSGRQIFVEITGTGLARGQRLSLRARKTPKEERWTPVSDF